MRSARLQPSRLHLLSLAWVRWVRHAAAVVLALGVTLGGFAASGVTTASPNKEYDIKAAFLFNFASFVEWPSTAFATPSAPFVIGILGDDPFGPILEEIVDGEQINGHPIAVRRLTSRQFAEAGACHILFIGKSESRRLVPLLQQLRGRPVLTVADLPNFLDLGGTIGFSTQGRVRLSINPTAVRAAHLNVSSKLLRLAEVVDREIPSP